ncbi:MAG: protein kinase [Myxococcales bacterium]|nr:protein kinase [Myxococcales bacterium]
MSKAPHRSSEIAALPPLEELIGRRLKDRYLLQEPLGRGGMGAVFLAEDQARSRPVAIKLIATQSEGNFTELENRMRREINVLLVVEDPCVVRLLDWGEDPDYGLFYAMEYLERAVTLRDYNKSYEPSLSVRLGLLIQVLQGLQALHRVRVVHRDLKTTNALCIPTNGPLPTLKLIDTGIARWFPEALRTQVTVETRPNAILGTPAYMPPEMWSKEEPDARTDIYQAGILGYELLAGELPFTGTPFQIMHDHMYMDLPSLLEKASLYPDIPERILRRLDEILLQATEKEPEDRYQEARGFLDDLSALLEEEDLVLPLSTPLPSGVSTFEESPSLTKEKTKPSLDLALPSQEATQPAPSRSTAPPQTPLKESRGRGLLLTMMAIILLVSGLGFFYLGPRANTPPDSSPQKTQDPDSSRLSKTPQVKRKTSVQKDPKQQAKQVIVLKRKAVPSPARHVEPPSPPTPRPHKRKAKKRASPRIQRPTVGDTL